MNRSRFIIRAILAVFLCLAALVAIAFLVVVDIVDDISRHEHARAREFGEMVSGKVIRAWIEAETQRLYLIEHRRKTQGLWLI